MLQKDRHPNRDLFVADFATWSLKDDQASMEHPLFSLSKNPDQVTRHYEHNGSTVTIAPGNHGMPTIWDKDILIFCCSQLVEGMKRGREPKREIVFPAYEFLVSTNRSTGRGYQLIISALKRLSGVLITTNIETGGEIEDKGFHLIGEWEAKYTVKGDRIQHILVELPRWLFRAVTNLEVLTLNGDFFRLDGGLERRLYELSRKHCGIQAKWSIGIPLLHKKSGSTAPLKRFRQAVKSIARPDEMAELLDYRLRFDVPHDRLDVYSTGQKGSLKAIKDILGQ